uniref:GDNF/GAS1 domain-containing protein n=2 Tax=Clastoptera arizonana TaxID=38151 RepID=A0A1B6BXN5_9HEMI
MFQFGTMNFLRIMIFSTISLSSITLVKAQCTKQFQQSCTKLADPLLKDPRLIYPDNLADVDQVCSTWSQFVNCVKIYTEKCFTDERLKEFNKAVENPVIMVHDLCATSNYQTEYLKHAKCMKATLTEDSHCGRHYRNLVAQVSAGETNKMNMCCSHHRFRECVLDQTSRTCDRDAGPFAHQMLDKALSFLREQCSSYIPSPKECPGADFYFTGRTDDGTVVETSLLNTKPSIGATTMVGKSSDFESEPTWVSMPSQTRPGGTSKSPDWSNQPSPTWMPGKGRPGEQTVTSDTISTHTESSNTRSSYGRGMNWPSSEATTGSSWKVTGRYQTEAPWYPSRPGNQMMIDNDIDEPNQQGLGSRNVAQSRFSQFKALYLFKLVLLIVIFTR